MQARDGVGVSFFLFVQRIFIYFLEIVLDMAMKYLLKHL